MTTTFKVGDIVTYKATFLRSCGWYTNVPRNGLVKEVNKCGSMTIATVEWNEFYEEEMSVNTANLIMYSERHREPN